MLDLGLLWVQTSYINRAPMNKRMITPTQPDPPEAACVVCGRAHMHLTIDTKRPLSVLVSQVGCHTFGRR